MQQILDQFGVQPILLTAQIINFLVLLYILKRLLYKPILKVLQTRKETIAQSLKNAEEIEQKLQKTEEEREKTLQKTADEAKSILNEATKTAEGIIQQAHLKAQQDLESVMKKGQETIQLEREKMNQEMREELADIVTIALEKIVGKSINPKDQKEMIEKTVKQI